MLAQVHYTSMMMMMMRALFITHQSLYVMTRDTMCTTHLGYAAHHYQGHQIKGYTGVFHFKFSANKPQKQSVGVLTQGALSFLYFLPLLLSLFIIHILRHGPC